MPLTSVYMVSNDAASFTESLAPHKRQYTTPQLTKVQCCLENNPNITGLQMGVRTSKIISLHCYWPFCWESAVQNRNVKAWAWAPGSDFWNFKPGLAWAWMGWAWSTQGLRPSPASISLDKAWVNITCLYNQTSGKETMVSLHTEQSNPSFAKLL